MVKAGNNATYTYSVSFVNYTGNFSVIADSLIAPEQFTITWGTPITTTTTAVP